MDFETIIVQIGNPDEDSIIKVLGREFKVNKESLLSYNKIKLKASTLVLKKYRSEKGIVVIKKKEPSKKKSISKKVALNER